MFLESNALSETALQETKLMIWKEAGTDWPETQFSLAATAANQSNTKRAVMKQC